METSTATLRLEGICSDAMMAMDYLGIHDLKDNECIAILTKTSAHNRQKLHVRSMYATHSLLHVVVLMTVLVMPLTVYKVSPVCPVELVA